VSTDLEESARAEVAVGDLAYWPPGQALCLFFGPTPASVGDEPRAASPANVVGRLENAATLRGVADGTPVRVSRAS